jgi:outer membrane receptor protein involved in Fe transport
VHNSLGEGISFASISGASDCGTACDEDGKFELSLSKPTKIVVQALGYLPDTLLLSADLSPIDILLHKKTYELNAIGITAKQSLASRSNCSVLVANKKEIEHLNPQNIAEVLQTKAGFTNKQSYQAPLTFRGMSGKSLLVLRNGNRRFSSYPAGYMSHTINVYDLERIEVEKGSASVIYGAGAMAGIINLIDKSPFKQNGFNAKISTGYGSINSARNVLACGGWSDGKIAVKAGMRYRKADNYKYPDGSTAINSFYTDKDLNVSTGYRFSENSNLILTADLHDGGPWGKAVGFNGSNYMKITTDNEISNNYSAKYTKLSTGVVSKLEVNVFYSNEDREFIKKYYTAAEYQLSYVETTNFSDYYYGTRFLAQLNVSNKYSIKTGAEGYSFHISTPVDAVDYIYEVNISNRVSYNARSYISGLFMQNNYAVNPKLKLTAGLRFDYAKVYQGDVYSTEQDDEEKSTKTAITGNLAANIVLGNDSRLKINVARSFRMPEPTELFTDSYTSNGLVYANPDLLPEYSYSMDLSYRFTPSVLDFEISPFLWCIDNLISKEEITGMPGTNYQYVNIGKSRLWGGEITVGLPLTKVLSTHDKLRFSAGLAYLNGTDLTDEKGYFRKGTPLDYVPPLNAKGSLIYSNTFKNNFEYKIGINAIYYAEQSRKNEDTYTTPSYTCWGSTAEITAPKWKFIPSLRLSVNNLMNKEYYCYQSYLPSEGRDIRAFLNFTF